MGFDYADQELVWLREEMKKSIELKKKMRGLGFSDAFSFEYFRRRQRKLKMLFIIEMTTLPFTAVLESFAFAFWCVRIIFKY